MRVRLVILSGSTTRKKIELSDDKFLIGRATDCQLRARSELVSRHHCVILQEKNFVGVRDFGSKNGTFVNGNRVNGEHALHSGDQLQIGPIEFRVEIDAVPAAEEPPASVSEMENSDPVDELDVSNWVDDGLEETKEQVVELHKKQETRVDDTSEIDVAGVEQETTRVKPMNTSATTKSKQTPGKLPPIVKNTSEDSTQAAADILKQLQRRR